MSAKCSAREIAPGCVEVSVQNLDPKKDVRLTSVVNELNRQLDDGRINYLEDEEVRKMFKKMLTRWEKKVQDADVLFG